MALAIVKLDHKLQLSDEVKRLYPSSVIVDLRIEDLLNVPSLTGQTGKFLRINNNAVEFADPSGLGFGPAFPGSPLNGQIFLLTAGNKGLYVYNGTASRWDLILSNVAGSPLQLGDHFPGSPANNMPFVLTRQQGSNVPGLYKYTSAGSTWDLLIASNQSGGGGGLSQSEVDARIATWARFGNTDTIPTNKLPAGTGGGGQGTGGASAFSELTGRLALDQLPQTTFFYGFTASQTNNKLALTALRPLVNTALTDDSIRQEKTVSSILLSGALLDINAPAAAGSYYAWIALKTSDINNLFFGEDDTNWKSAGTATYATEDYTLFVRTAFKSAGRNLRVLIKDYE